MCGPGFAAIAETTLHALDSGVDAVKTSKALKGGRADRMPLQEYMQCFAFRDYRYTGRIATKKRAWSILHG